MKELIRINTGKAVHEANVWISETTGKKEYSVGCGASKHSNRDVVRKAGKNEVVTCKKCLARMENKEEINEMDELKKIWEEQQTKRAERKAKEEQETKELKAIWEMQHAKRAK